MKPWRGEHRRTAFRWLDEAGTVGQVSDAAAYDHDVPHGTGLLPRDLTDEEAAALPALESLEQLEIEDLTDEEYKNFIVAIS